MPALLAAILELLDIRWQKSGEMFRPDALKASATTFGNVVVSCAPSTNAGTLVVAIPWFVRKLVGVFECRVLSWSMMTLLQTVDISHTHVVPHSGRARLMRQWLSTNRCSKTAVRETWTSSEVSSEFIDFEAKPLLQLGFIGDLRINVNPLQRSYHWPWQTRTKLALMGGGGKMFWIQVWHNFWTAPF